MSTMSTIEFKGVTIAVNGKPIDGVTNIRWEPGTQSNVTLPDLDWSGTLVFEKCDLQSFIDVLMPPRGYWARRLQWKSRRLRKRVARAAGFDGYEQMRAYCRRRGMRCEVES